MGKCLHIFRMKRDSYNWKTALETAENALDSPEISLTPVHIAQKAKHGFFI